MCSELRIYKIDYLPNEAWVGPKQGQVVEKAMGVGLMVLTQGEGKARMEGSVWRHRFAHLLEFSRFSNRDVRMVPLVPDQ